MGLLHRLAHLGLVVMAAQTRIQGILRLGFSTSGHHSAVLMHGG